MKTIVALGFACLPASTGLGAQQPHTLGISGSQKVRNLRQQEDLGTFRDAFGTRVPRHGAMLLKIGAPRQRS